MQRLLVFILGIALLSCGAQPQQTPLLGNIPSQLGPDEVRKLIKAGPKDWVVVDDSLSKGNEKRPPFDILTIAISEYGDLGESGEARFYFFNNKLMATAFYPRNVDGYRKKLEDQKHVKFEVHKQSFLRRILYSLFGVKSEDLAGRPILEIRLTPNTRIELLKDYRSKENFYFEDTYLAEKHDKWIRDHS